MIGVGDASYLCYILHGLDRRYLVHGNRLAMQPCPLLISYFPIFLLLAARRNRPGRGYMIPRTLLDSDALFATWYWYSDDHNGTLMNDLFKCSIVAWCAYSDGSLALVAKWQCCHLLRRAKLMRRA